MSVVMEHLLEKVYEPNEVPYFADGQVPIAVVRRLIEQAEQATEQRIIKLLEEMPWQVYSGVGIEGKPIESVWTPKVLIREDAIALIKGEK